MPQTIKGKYRGVTYDVDVMGYFYRIYSRDGKDSGSMNCPYTGPLPIGDREARVEYVRRQAYNAINRMLYRPKRRN